MYDFIYPKILRGMPHSTMAPQGSWKTGSKLAYNFRIWNFQAGANYQAKSESLDYGIFLPPILLQILYGVRGNSFGFFVRIWVEYSKNMTTIDKKLIFMILTCADLVQSKKNTDLFCTISAR